VLAPETVRPQGDWSIIESSPGVKQWAFRKMPVYTHTLDSHGASLEGSDVPGWHNAYTQMAPPAPVGFTVNDMHSGQVLGDANGMTIYVYNCNDDAVDQLACNHPDTPQEYRLAICGRGDPELCLKNFPYVIAPKGAKSNSHIWSTMDIDPHTGKKVAPSAAGALHVWAYRDRPVYYCARDKKPGDIECDSWGEFNGARNGYKAFWLRDDFGGNAGSSRGL
jgi:predicted lipoprotein with Yx(FWY)xxD motif